MGVGAKGKELVVLGEEQGVAAAAGELFDQDVERERLRSADKPPAWVSFLVRVTKLAPDVAADGIVLGVALLLYVHCAILVLVHVVQSQAQFVGLESIAHQASGLLRLVMAG